MPVELAGLEGVSGQRRLLWFRSAQHAQRGRGMGPRKRREEEAGDCAFCKLT